MSSFDMDRHNKKVQEIIRLHYKSLDNRLYKRVVDVSIEVVKSGDLIIEQSVCDLRESFGYKPYREKEFLQEKITKLEKQLEKANRLILTAKRQFAPSTTNSEADEYIDKYIKNKENK